MLFYKSLLLLFCLFSFDGVIKYLCLGFFLFGLLVSYFMDFVIYGNSASKVNYGFLVFDQFYKLGLVSSVESILLDLVSKWSLLWLSVLLGFSMVLGMLVPMVGVFIDWGVYYKYMSAVLLVLFWLFVQLLQSMSFSVYGSIEYMMENLGIEFDKGGGMLLTSPYYKSFDKRSFVHMFFNNVLVLSLLDSLLRFSKFLLFVVFIYNMFL